MFLDISVLELAEIRGSSNLHFLGISGKGEGNSLGTFHRHDYCIVDVVSVFSVLFFYTFKVPGHTRGQGNLDLYSGGNCINWMETGQPLDHWTKPSLPTCIDRFIFLLLHIL